MKAETYLILVIITVLGLLIADLGQAYQAFHNVGGVYELLK